MPGGNQVDGLPPVLLLDGISKKLIFLVDFSTKITEFSKIVQAHALIFKMEFWIAPEKGKSFEEPHLVSKARQMIEN